MLQRDPVYNDMQRSFKRTGSMDMIQDLLTAAVFASVLLSLPPVVDKISGLLWQLIKLINKDYYNKMMND